MTTQVEIFWDVSDPAGEGWAWRLIDHETGQTGSGPVDLAVDDAEARALVSTVIDDADISDAEIIVYSSVTARRLYCATVTAGEVSFWRWLV